MVGIDIVGLDEARHLLRAPVRDRLLAPGEIARLGSEPLGLIEAFAVKEAVLKALGWGIDHGLARFAEIEYAPEPGPVVRLHGETDREVRRRGGEMVAVTVPLDSGVMAVARLCRADPRPAADDLLRAARAAAAAMERRRA